MAERLGMTVATLLDTMSSRELSEWMAFDRVHVSEAWRQTAQLCWVVAASMGGSSRAPKLEDFLPVRRRAEAEAEGGGAGVFRALKAFAIGHNARVAEAEAAEIRARAESDSMLL